MSKPIVSIICPVYNEEENIPEFYRRMNAVCSELSQYEFEFVFTDNRSADRSFALLRELAAKDPRVKGFRFSRNFGYQKSILTGYSLARGAVAIEFDCDLQDPPELLPQFLEAWRNGAQVVYGIRMKREEGYFVTALRKLFYRLLSRLSDNDLPADAGDFMLLDRRVLNELSRIRDQNLYIRGIVFEMGFRREGIPYERRGRVRGASKFPMRRMIELALDGIISQSILPLRVASFTGMGIAFGTFILTLIYIGGKLTGGFEAPLGFTTIAVLILFSISLNAIFLGIIGEYLARIYIQTKGRPLTIIDEMTETR